MTHPFHPLAGQECEYVGERRNMHGLRLLCQADDGVLWTVPVEWTDRVEQRLELQMGAGRTYFLVGDLLALSELLAKAARHERVEDV